MFSADKLDNFLGLRAKVAEVVSASNARAAIGLPGDLAKDNAAMSLITTSTFNCQSEAELVERLRCILKYRFNINRTGPQEPSTALAAALWNFRHVAA